MTSAPLRRWIGARRPRAPEAMMPWLDVEEAPELRPWEALTRSGIESLDRARAVPGRVRDSALHLLRADALLTYACEAALDEPDPGETLTGILSALGVSGS